jgi:predicted enzyme related to lactoylglutathione lyase
MQLSAFRLFVNDLIAAKNFYGDTLKLPALEHNADYGYCVFNAGGPTLVVETVPAEAEPEDQALVGRFTGLSFSVADIQTTYAELLTRGVKFAEPPEQQFWGGWTATFYDPAGNALQLAQYPN